MDPDKISVKLDCGLFEAGWSLETHSKKSTNQFLGEIFLQAKFKMAIALPMR